MQGWTLLMQGGRPGVTPSTEKVPVDKPTENSICFPTEKRTLFAHVRKTALMVGVTFIARWMTFIARWMTFIARGTPGSHPQHRESAR